MRLAIKSVLVALLLAAAPASAHEDKHDGRRMVFPKTATGQMILPVDLHTHSVFSDGSVWPNIRVQEAERDGLAAMAVTEHLEYQPHAADIPHRDRNRSHAVATQAAAGKQLLVINGAEITRDMPPGHVNAVFVTDANALRTRDAEAAIRIANTQGAFVFWNHPYWTAQTPDGVARLLPLHERLIAAGQLHGVEVANGADYSEAALQIALDKNLAIIGTSDIHDLVDWDYDIANGGHRTVTLVIARDGTADAIRDALRARQTVAWYKGLVIGRPEQVTEVVRSALTMKVNGLVENSRLVRVTIRNASSVAFTLKAAAPHTIYNSGDLFTVPAHGQIELHLSGGVEPANVALAVEVVNSVIAPDRTLSLTLPAAR